MLSSSPMKLARKGVIAAITQFLVAHNGSVLHADDHIDSGLELLLARMEWDLDGFDLQPADFEPHFRPVANAYGIKYHLVLNSYRNVAILVSGFDHCLVDLLYRHNSGELNCDITHIISSQPATEKIANFYGIPFYLLRDPKNKQTSEGEISGLLGQEVDLIVLARYMQILTPEFVGHYLLRLINIHHSFLPAFVGAKPYHQAFERGVKLIGATSHYVTAGLDEGPIIEQDIVRVSHRDTVEDMMRKGRDLEKVVLSRAVRWHLENRVLVYQNKTVVFA